MDVQVKNDGRNSPPVSELNAFILSFVSLVCQKGNEILE